MRLNLLRSAAAAGCLVLASCAVKVEERRPPAPAPEAEPAAEPAVTVEEEAAAPEEVITVKAKPILRAEDTGIVSGPDQPVHLKGCNLGNWLLLEMWMLDLDDVRDQYEFEQILASRFGAAEKDRLMELYRAHWIRERDFEIIRRFGFNCVRLPFNYRLLEDDSRPFHLRPNAFQWLDWCVAMAAKHGLYVILDLHGVQGGQSVDHTTGRAGQNKLWTSPQDQQRAAWLWKQIAERYRDTPAVAGYDLINEPFGDWNTAAHSEAAPPVMDLLYRSVRSVDTNHLVFIAGTQQGIEIYGPPAARGWENVAFTEHYYPGLFGGEPSPETHAKFLARNIPARVAYLQRINTPFLVGEFNVVWQSVGGAALMRRYYDVYAGHGWAATMWAYKLVKKAGGAHEDSWSMVKNRDPLPLFSARTSSRADIESYFRWLGTMEYSLYENLGAAMTMARPPPVALPDVESLPSEPPAQDPPGEWQTTDVAGARAGGQRVFSPHAMDVYGSGEDIWNDRDQFRFVWRKVSGDFDLQATLNSLSMSHEFAKAGLMIRNSLEPDSAHFLLNVFPTGETMLGWRSADGEKMEQKMLKPVTFPVNLRMRRRGEKLEVGCSTDVVPWQKTTVHTSAGLRRDVYVGLAVLSHDNRYLATASFTNINFRAATGAPW